MVRFFKLSQSVLPFFPSNKYMPREFNNIWYVLISLELGINDFLVGSFRRKDIHGSRLLTRRWHWRRDLSPVPPQGSAGDRAGNLWELIWCQWLGFLQHKKKFLTAVNCSLPLWLFIWVHYPTFSSSPARFFVFLAVLKQLKWSITRGILLPLTSRFMMLLSTWHGELTFHVLGWFYSSMHRWVWISTTWK